MNIATERRRGVVAATAGVLVLSFDALLVRLTDAPGADIAFWRGVLVLLSAGSISWLRRRHVDWPQSTPHWLRGLMIAALYGVNALLFVLAINNTQVANTVVILASAPLFAAGLAWIIFRESTPVHTLAAILVAIVGVMIVFSSSLGQPGQLGDLLALILAANTALTLTLLRRMPDLPRLPVVAGSGIFSALISWPFAAPLQLEAASYGWLAIMGLVQIPLATVLIFNATRYLPSAEVSLFLLIETILGPLWVWWILGESMPGPTLAGGSLILGGIILNTLLSIRQRLRQPPVAAEK